MVVQASGNNSEASSLLVLDHVTVLAPSHQNADLVVLLFECILLHLDDSLDELRQVLVTLHRPKDMSCLSIPRWVREDWRADFS